jgi:ATP-dependent 26S proteasome regulatory subunit
MCRKILHGTPGTEKRIEAAKVAGSKATAFIEGSV